MTDSSGKRKGGFTLIEMLVAMVVGSMLITGLFKLWSTNQRETNRIQNKGDFKNRATLATTALNRSITMAGFGISKMDVISHSVGDSTDTLILYSNPQERRTTLRDTAQIHASEILVFTDSGFVIGGMIGITDSLQQEYNRVTSIYGDSTSGYTLGLAGEVRHKFTPGIPDVYPVQRETFYIDSDTHELIHIEDERRKILAGGMSEFRVVLMDGSGNATIESSKIRVLSFSLTGSYKAPTGIPSLMRFSSTVIPRNIL